VDGLRNKETGRKATGRRRAVVSAVEIVVAHDRSDLATLPRTSTLRS
jgi:hypothetical protein